jgi:hypothetical protein
MSVDDDPMQWELDQIDKLNELADVYGWEKHGKEYQKRVKLIQAQSVGRQKRIAKGGDPKAVKAAGTAAAQTMAKSFGSQRPKPSGWATMCVHKKGRRFKTFTTAKALLGGAPYGNWQIDKDAPSGTGWRRFISIDKNGGGYARRRIVQSKGAHHPCPSCPSPSP